MVHSVLYRTMKGYRALMLCLLTIRSKVHAFRSGEGGHRAVVSFTAVRRRSGCGAPSFRRRSRRGSHQRCSLQTGPSGSITSTRLQPASSDAAAAADDDASLLLSNYERDVAKVLRELRPWEYDPTVPGWFRTRRLSFTNYWGLEEWEIHSSRWRHVRHVIDFPRSRLLRRVLPTLAFLLGWSVAAVQLARRHRIVDRWEIPLTSLSLVSTFVAALLTLRSNQGLARLGDARLALGRMVLHTRDTAMLLAAYAAPGHPALAVPAARHLAVFGWVLKEHFRETTPGARPHDVVDALLSPADAAYVKHQRKRPVALLARLRQILRELATADGGAIIGTTEHRLMEQNLQQLNDVVTVGERIRASPVPPVYNAHATRLMIVYLLCLPLALLGARVEGRSVVAVTSEC